MKEGVMMNYKAIKANLLTVVGLLFESIAVILKPKGSIKVSFYISKPT